MKYWNHCGKYQTQYQNLKKDLLPLHGKAKTVEGELFRAACNLYHDYYNNGFCNNVSGECNYLLKMNKELNLNLDNELLAIEKDAKYIVYTEKDFAQELETIVDTIIIYIASALGNYTENDIDCLSMMDKDYIPYDTMIIDYY
jgi:hypothetical protein